jgi:hypothetical protein
MIIKNGFPVFMKTVADLVIGDKLADQSRVRSIKYPLYTKPSYSVVLVNKDSSVRVEEWHGVTKVWVVDEEPYY